MKRSTKQVAAVGTALAIAGGSAAAEHYIFEDHGSSQHQEEPTNHTTAAPRRTVSATPSPTETTGPAAMVESAKLTPEQINNIDVAINGLAAKAQQRAAQASPSRVYKPKAHTLGVDVYTDNNQITMTVERPNETDTSPAGLKDLKLAMKGGAVIEFARRAAGDVKPGELPWNVKRLDTHTNDGIGLKKDGLVSYTWNPNEGALDDDPVMTVQLPGKSDQDSYNTVALKLTNDIIGQAKQLEDVEEGGHAPHLAMPTIPMPE